MFGFLLIRLLIEEILEQMMEIIYVMNISQFSYCSDGRNTAPVDKVVYRGIYKVLYIPGGAGFVPSTVGPRLSCLSIGKPDFFDITPHPGI